MLKRKIEDILKKWKDTEGHRPLILKGCRQCGKTFSVRKFARENYAHEIYLNFYELKLPTCQTRLSPVTTKN